jgi:hypothetical protein
MKELKERLEELYLAVRLTKTAFRNCDTPSLKDLYLANLEYYATEIGIAEYQLLVYTNSSAEDH